MKSCLSSIALTALATLAAGNVIASPIQLFPDGASPVYPDDNGDATMAQWVIDTVALYNGAHGTSYDTSGVDPTGHDAGANTPTGPLTINLNVSEYDYLALHWGGNTRNGDVTHQLFYLGDCPDFATFDFDDPSGKGLSYYRFYGSDPSTTTPPMPDGGATLAMLAGGLAAVSGIRRRLAKS